MSTLAVTSLTLADIAKQRDPSGKIGKIVEMMSQNNEMLPDIPFVECNKTDSHVSNIRTGLPTVYWRKMNQGVASSKSRTAQVEEGCGMLEAWSKVDVALADLGGEPGKVRFNEAKAFVEAMGQEVSQTYVYGAASSPEEFVGLAARYSSTTAANGANVISGSGAGSDNSSIWLIGWGEDSIHGIYPKGSQAGIKHNARGAEVENNAGGTTGANLLVYRDQFTFQGGLVVKDWRYGVRIPNIDISNLVAKSSAADLIELMIKAVHRLPSTSSCKPVFYMNRSVYQMLDIQIRDDVISGGGLTYQNVDGKVAMAFRGIPVKKLDVLTETESAVA